MKVHFSGAAHGVTGSKHLLEINGKFILLECGLFQGKRKEADKKNRNLPWDPSTIDAVILSHAHLDHCGNLPSLTKKGYKGDIFMTEQTADIVPLMLSDSAYIQEMDNRFVAKHLKNPEIPLEPLYTQEDLPPVFSSIRGKKFRETFEVLENSGIFCTFYEAGHILGAAVVEVSWTENGEEKKLVFSGDLGRPLKNMLPDLVSPPKADYLIVESTYGDRLHEDSNTLREKLAAIINRTVEQRGKILIPSFSLQRTQELVYDLHLLQQDGKIPFIPIYVDSPLAIKVTDVYKKWRSSFDQDTHDDFFSKGAVPLESKYIKYTSSVEDSKRLKDVTEPCIILSASGMCEGGRIRHHLKNEIGDRRNTILFVGYQAQYTLGRRILEQRPAIKIFDQFYKVKANIEKINGYSGHADYEEILDFIRPISELKRVFVVHGEPAQSYAFANKLRNEDRKWLVEVPEPGDIIDPEECMDLCPWEK